MKLDIDLSFPFEEKFYFYFLNRASVLYISNLPESAEGQRIHSLDECGKFL